jgi:gliding motility-associated-like protein
MIVGQTAGTCSNPNGTIILTGTGGTGPYQYSINGGPYQASGTFNNLVGGMVYNVSVMDATMATFSQGVLLGNIAGPLVLVQPIAASCANNDGELDVIITGGTQPMVVSVDGIAHGNSNLIGGLASGNQFVSVTDNNGCIASQFANIPLNDNLSLVMGPGPTICEGTSTTLTETTNATGFNWTPAGSLNNANIAGPVANPAATTTYTLTASLGVCVATGPETVTVLPAPTPTANAVAELCAGQSVQLQGGGGVTYQWSPPTYLSSTTIPDPVVQAPQKSITYSLNVTGANGCSSVQPALVLVIVAPPPVVFAGDDTAILIGQTLQLDAVDVNKIGFTNYQWSPAIGLDNPSIQDPVATITGDITYMVTATTPQGCTGTDSIFIKAVTMSDIIVPNAFTPNGDGRNDVLRVHAIGIKDFKYFMVFNRWGQRVFYSVSEGLGWDGLVGGQAQPMGTYVWMAEGVDFAGRAVMRQGTVILVR